MEENELKKRFVGNTSWMIIQRIYTMLFSLVIGSLSARYLGPENYGVINYGASIISFFSILCSLGLESIFVAEMMKSPERQGSFIGTALFMRFCASVLSFLLICIIIRVLEPTDSLIWIVTELQAVSIIFSSYEVLLYWFQMRLEMKYVSLATIISTTVTGIWRIILLATDQDVTFFSFTSSINAFVLGLVVLMFFIKRNNTKLQINRNDGIYLLSKSYHYIIVDLAIIIYMQIDRVMLGKWVSSEAVGYYSAAATIATLWEFIPMALISSARPLILQKSKDDYGGSVDRLEILICAINMLGFLYGVGVLLFGSTIIRILYGEKYLSAVPTMNILVWSTSFAVLGSARSIWIVATDKNKYTPYYISIGAIINVILNAIMIPLWGIEGAAITTLISQFIVAIVTPLFFRETREFGKIFINSFKHVKDVFLIIYDVIRKRVCRI